MNKPLLSFLILFLAIANSLFGQTKVSGVVVDKFGKPIPFANVSFKDAKTGIVTNEDGIFYIESNQNFSVLFISSVGFSDKEVVLSKLVLYNIKIQLNEPESLKEVVIYRGKTSKKNNPALDILRKIWERKRKNGLYAFAQYQLEKYEKVEFDLNTIDSAFMKQKIFKGMEFIFKQVDTSKITGKTYLPIFINESLYDVYGDAKLKKVKEIMKANKTKGFEGNELVLSFIKDLYAEYNIYDNHLTFFDKSFTSPLSQTGIDTYNYVLKDSSFIDKKWCYNIVFYPRRKNELTFKGDFWVNDSTFAVKKINMAVTKSANINWVKDIYIQQDFDVVNDSTFLLSRDYMMSDFALNKEENSKGIYGKRTTLYRNHEFNKEKPASFYKEEVNRDNRGVFDQSDEYWENNRFENLNKDEIGVYKLLDTLKTVKKFKNIYDFTQIIASGYINKKGIDYGPIFSAIGYNQVEGLRLRFGVRTYFGHNDLWRLQAFTAYGFRDDKFKYGFSGKWMLGIKNRLILSVGTRRDIEQIGASLTMSNDVLGRSYASSGIFTAGDNVKLTQVNLTNVGIEIEPIKNLQLLAGFSYRTLESASSVFNLDYFTNDSHTGTKSSVRQSEFNFQIHLFPNLKTVGYGVERSNVENPYSKFFINYSQGVKGFLNSDFDYKKIQVLYKQPLIIGPLGRSNLTLELGKTFGQIPLGLLSIIPGNQNYIMIGNTFNNLNFYEFVADQYATLQWDHNFGGRLFSRIPLIRKLDWREIIGIKTAYGTISNENKAINASDLIYQAPEKIYWEYSAGIGNIGKIFRIDFSWRGNYLNTPQTNRFCVKASFGFYF